MIFLMLSKVFFLYLERLSNPRNQCFMDDWDMMYYRDTLFNRPDGGRKGTSKSQYNQELKVMAVVSYYTAGYH